MVEERLMDVTLDMQPALNLFNRIVNKPEPTTVWEKGRDAKLLINAGVIYFDDHQTPMSSTRWLTLTEKGLQLRNLGVEVDHFKILWKVLNNQGPVTVEQLLSWAKNNGIDSPLNTVSELSLAGVVKTISDADQNPCIVLNK